ncbi:hypothetical protein T484DRAFT_1919978, partial [Baffinella frigidus]
MAPRGVRDRRQPVRPPARPVRWRGAFWLALSHLLLTGLSHTTIPDPRVAERSGGPGVGVFPLLVLRGGLFELPATASERAPRKKHVGRQGGGLLDEAALASAGDPLMALLMEAGVDEEQVASAPLPKDFKIRVRAVASGCKTPRASFVTPADVLRDNVAWINVTSEEVGRRQLGGKRRRALDAVQAAAAALLPPVERAKRPPKQRRAGEDKVVEEEEEAPPLPPDENDDWDRYLMG